MLTVVNWFVLLKPGAMSPPVCERKGAGGAKGKEEEVSERGQQGAGVSIHVTLR